MVSTHLALAQIIKRGVAEQPQACGGAKNSAAVTSDCT